MTESGNDASEDRPSRYARPTAPPAALDQPSPTADRPVVPRLRSRYTSPGHRRRVIVKIIRLAGPPAALAVVATLALVAALVTLERARSLAVNAWLLSIGGLLVWTCLRALAAALPTTAPSAFDSVRSRPPEPPTRLRDVIAIEGVILDAEWSWNGVEFRLRPLLRKLAAARLIERYQVDLEAEPAAAHRILGDELWALVGPGAYGPARDAHVAVESAAVEPATARTDVRTSAQISTERAHSRQGRGIPRATIRRAIEVLEAL